MPHVRAAPFASTLSFLVPGLGQAALGRPVRAIVFLAPLLAMALVAVAFAVSLAGDPSEALDLLVRPDVFVALVAIDVVLLAWHLLAVLDAERLARAVHPIVGRARVPAAILLVGLVVATVALHGTLGLVGSEAADTLGTVFVGDGPDASFSIPEPSFGPDPAGALEGGDAAPSPADDGSGGVGGSPSASSPTPTGPEPASVAPGTPGGSSSASPSAGASASASTAPAPRPTPASTATPAWARDGRLNLLLIGSDAGPDRWSLRTDTIIVLSVNVRSGRAALFGIPRNLIGVPLPPESAKAVPGGHFPGLLNALYVYAMRHPDSFPGGDARGMRAVAGAVQELVGVRLDGMVVVNLAGFVRLVDELGGLWIDVPEAIVDHMYPLEDGSKLIELRIAAGCQHFDGRMALAYARSRHQDSDYGRMRRQQTVLLALRRQVDPVALVPRIPGLLRVARDTLWTTIPRSDLRSLARLASRVDPRRVSRVLFTPSRYPAHLDTDEIRAIQARVRTIFAGPAPAPDRDLAPGHCP